LTLATKITLFRLALVPVFCALIFVYTPERTWARGAAIAVYLTAAISDLVDGYIARNFNQRTVLGTRLDPTADKLLINLGYIFIASNEHLVPQMPMWFPVFILARDIIIVGGTHAINELVGPMVIQPKLLGKLNTFAQISCLIVFLLGLSIAPWLVWFTLGIGVISLLDYMLVGFLHSMRRRTA